MEKTKRVVGLQPEKDIAAQSIAIDLMMNATAGKRIIVERVRVSERRENKSETFQAPITDLV